MKNFTEKKTEKIDSRPELGGEKKKTIIKEFLLAENKNDTRKNSNLHEGKKSIKNGMGVNIKYLHHQYNFFKFHF